MSDKNRKKKDGKNKDKQNQNMREAINARQSEEMTERERQKHEAKLTNSEPRGEAKRRLRPDEKKKAAAGGSKRQ